ncbi:MAG: Txe/YoeB family addiction module toxin [Lishizhenia sp.]
MRICWTSTAWKDYLNWQSTDKKKLKRINTLIKETLRNPTEGIGNPEALKHDLQGYWSRRIDSEHRLVYSVPEFEIVIVACRYHY